VAVGGTGVRVGRTGVTTGGGVALGKGVGVAVGAGGLQAANTSAANRIGQVMRVLCTFISP